MPFRLLTCAFGLLLCLGCHSNNVVVDFWATSTAPPPNIDLGEHPCGFIVSLRTNQVPQDTPWLESEQIFEIDEIGNVIQTWNVPVDYYPVAYDGESMFLAMGSWPNRLLEVTKSGRLSYSPNEKRPKEALTSCPAQFSDEFYCVKLPPTFDRLFAARPVCT